MKRIVILLSVLISPFFLFAQTEKTVLFLIPFFGNTYNAQEIVQIKESEDIENTSVFQLMGFWAGAQIALDEFNDKQVPLNIIVKDVSNDETKLRNIMEDQSLMSKVDLIIGPFFGKQFMIAANYAKNYKIPIINPFTSKQDILNNNPYVYKLSPSIYAEPAMISFMLDMYPQHKLMIYADTVQDKQEYKAYSQYFREKNIPYTLMAQNKNIVSQLQSDKKNIVLVLSSKPAQMLMLSRDILFNANLDNLVLVVPEEWFEEKTYDVEYYSKLNLHFFSDYFVDMADENTQVFVHKYLEKFNAPPLLKNFSFQGYDVTKYFITALLNDMDLDRVKYNPLAYRFTFDKVKDGGYENVNIQFLEVKDNEIVPVEF